MRKIDIHKVGDCKLDLFAVDQPGPGGAHHYYELTFPDANSPGYKERKVRYGVTFQKGPIKEAGSNGITQEALIAICIDRLRSFQAGPFACRENAIALTKLEEALLWLHHRTRDRMARNVEGESKI